MCMEPGKVTTLQWRASGCRRMRLQLSFALPDHSQGLNDHTGTSDQIRAATLKKKKAFHFQRLLNSEIWDEIYEAAGTTEVIEQHQK